MTDERIVGTPHGEARIVAHRARRPVATLALGHGAGAGIESGDLVSLAARLPKQDINVFLIEQPWRRAGRKLAPAPKLLDEAWIAIIGQLRVRTPLVIGGRSAGARVACRTGAELGALAVLALGFPLHPPGRPEKSRADELLGTGLPTLVVQGGNDPFGGPAEFPEGAYALAEVPHGDHGFAVAKRAPLGQDEALALVVREVSGWLTSLRE